MHDITRRAFIAGAAAAAAVVTTPILRGAAAAADPALFVAAHPDDETLAMGVAVAEHLAAGQDVHMLWLTRGTASGAINAINGTTVATWWGVRHDPAAEGYVPLTADGLGTVRMAEAVNAVRALATGLPGTLTVHQADLPDGQVTQWTAIDAVTTVADQVNPGGPVRIKTHSHVVDNHPDHVAAGNAANWLRDHSPDKARFADVRHYILPVYWTDPRLSQVAESWDTPSNSGIGARAINACRSFAAWSPPHTFAVGYHSVPDYFKTIDCNPRCMVHT